MNRKKCPECETFNTERVHVEWHTDNIAEVRICEECPAEYEVRYSWYDKKVTHHG